MSIKLKR